MLLCADVLRHDPPILWWQRSSHSESVLLCVSTVVGEELKPSRRTMKREDRSVQILGCIKAPGRRCCGAEMLGKVDSAFFGSDEVTGVSRTVCPEPCVDIYTDILNEALASEQLA